MTTTEDVTPWSTVSPYAEAFPSWVSSMDGERVAAYAAYQNMYWSEENCLELIRRAEDGSPIYIPKPKTICDTTAHYLMKGVKIGVADVKADADLVAEIDLFIKRERYYSKFQKMKLAAVIRGDGLLHITANPKKAQGSRLSINSVDPASYFPEFDTDDLEKRTGVRLVELQIHPEDPTKTLVKVLHYWQEYDLEGNRISDLVWRQEDLFEMEGWNNPREAKIYANLIPRSTLPTHITTIPVYHYRNAEFDGFDFGNSELKGYERLFQAIDQAISDEEISLALVGLGVYATDAGRPKDSSGREVDWIVAPGTVWEMPGATMVKRLEGISSVTPVMDHLEYLENSLLEGSGTARIAIGDVDVQTAESGIALLLKFMPLLAKIEYRDIAWVEVMTQMWYDWKFWFHAYEGKDFTATEIVITLGNKLPVDRPKVFEELNNLIDRHIISRAYYREQLTLQLGYIFPDDIEAEMLKERVVEAKALLEVAQAQMTPAGPDQIGPGGRKVGAGDTLNPKDLNKSNNASRTNESNGTEVKA